MDRAIKKLLILFFCVSATALCFGQKNTTGPKETSKEIKPNKRKTKEEKWEVFFPKFKQAFTAKDKAKIVAMTSLGFFDGGGGLTITEWLETVVFADNKEFNRCKKILNNGVHNFKNPNTGDIYKATGKGDYLDLYFEYIRGKWLFGGVVGD